MSIRHTGKVGQSSLSTDEGGAANGCTHGRCGANGGAHGTGTEESGGHYVVCYGGREVDRRVVWLQWTGQSETRSASKCTERKEAQSSASTRRHPNPRMASTPRRPQHRDTEHYRYVFECKVVNTQSITTPRASAMSAVAMGVVEAMKQATSISRIEGLKTHAGRPQDFR
jgi:hypothetical protein